MQLNRPQKRKVQDPTIALINIVFLMLIFFLLAGTIAPGADPQIVLIRTSEAERAAPPAEPIGITAEGTLRYGGEPIDMDKLLATLSNTDAAPRQAADAKDESPDQTRSAETGEPLAITADRDLPATDLLGVLRDLKQAGYSARIVTRSAGRS